MPYETLATAKNPALVLMLLNMGSTMGDPIDDGTKVDVLNDLVNSVLIKLVQRSTKGHVVSPSYRLAMLAYGEKVLDLLGGIETIREVAQRGRALLSPTTTGNTAAAFLHAQRLLIEELPNLKGAPAPFVLHITDLATPCAGAEPVASAIMSRGVSDGNVLIVNVCVGHKFPGCTETELWKGINAETDLMDPALAALYRMSSPLPPTYAEMLASDGFSLEAGRHMLLPADHRLVEAALPMTAATPTQDRSSARASAPLRTSGHEKERRTFSPQPGESLVLFDQKYLVQEHPAAPGMTFGLEGGNGVVYKLQDSAGGAFALKLFREQYRTVHAISISNRLNLLLADSGLLAARRAIITEHEPITKLYRSLRFGVLMHWIDGRTWLELLTLAREKASAPYSASDGFILATRFLDIISGLEDRGIAHTDLSSDNVVIRLPRLDVQLLDLEHIIFRDCRVRSSESARRGTSILPTAASLIVLEIASLPPFCRPKCFCYRSTRLWALRSPKVSSERVLDARRRSSRALTNF